jgi:hypothetical protein
MKVQQGSLFGITFLLVAALFTISGCSSLSGGVQRGVSDGVSSGIAGLFNRGSSDSGASSSVGIPSSDASDPERNYSGNTQTVPWPQDSSWSRYGLSGLTQPSGTSVTGAALYQGYYMVGLINGGRPAFDDLVGQVDRISGSQLTTEMMSAESIVMGYSIPGGTVQIMVDLESGDIAIQAQAVES